MNTQHNFVVERPLAQHCTELLGKAQSRVDPKELLDDFAKQFAKHLASRVPAISGGKLAMVTESKRAEIAAYELAKTSDGPRNFISVIADGTAPDMLLCIDRSSALTLMDQAFGGNGELPEALPETLPRAAGPVLGRLALLVSDVLGKIGADCVYATKAQGDDLKKVIPFASTSACTTISWDVSEKDKQSWGFMLAFDPKDIAALTGSSATTAEMPKAARARCFADSGTCAEIPLTLDAVLAEIVMPVSRVAALKSGDILPIPIPRDVPLRIDGRRIARGPIGTEHDRIAVQITQIETPRGKSQ